MYKGTPNIEAMWKNRWLLLLCVIPEHTAFYESSTDSHTCRRSLPGNSWGRRYQHHPYTGASLGTNDLEHSMGRVLPVVFQ